MDFISEYINSIKDREISKEVFLAFFDKFYPPECTRDDWGRVSIYRPKLNNLADQMLQTVIAGILPYDSAIYLRQQLIEWNGNMLENSPDLILMALVDFNWRNIDAEKAYFSGDDGKIFQATSALYQMFRGRASLRYTFRIIFKECIINSIEEPEKLKESVLILLYYIHEHREELMNFSEKQSSNKKGKVSQANASIQKELENIILSKPDKSKLKPNEIVKDYLENKFKHFIDNRSDGEICPLHLSRFFDEYSKSHKSLRHNDCWGYYEKNRINKNNVFFRDLIKFSQKIINEIN